jgi:hypothetical protein
MMMDWATVKPGDADPTPARFPPVDGEESACSFSWATPWEDSRFIWHCTREVHGDGIHVAGTGASVAEVFHEK